MKLSHLVDYLNQLDALNISHMRHNSMAEFDSALTTVTQHHSVNWDQMYKPVMSTRNQLEQVYKEFTHHINSIQRHVRNIVAETESNYYQESTRLWYYDMPHVTDTCSLNQTLSVGADDKKILHGKVLSWSDWRFPGMILGPKNDTWIDDLVAMDPLYLVDQHQGLLDPVRCKFTPQYQQRLRYYIVNERQPRPIMESLPENQFGLIFAYNFFNYRPLEIICKWCSECFVKLRPGGTLFFTFNDCDYAHAVALAEQHYMCYTPGTRIIGHLAEAGFEIVERARGEADLYWIQATKPGKLQTMRAGQTLAKIVAKSK